MVKRFIFWTLVISVALWYGVPKIMLSVEHDMGFNPRVSAKDKALTAIGYVLDERQWTSFTLGASEEAVKVITNGTIPAQWESGIDDAWWYGVEYRVKDSNGKIVLEGENWFWTRLSTFYDVTNEETVPFGFYLNEEIVPTDGRVAILNLTSIDDAAEIQFRCSEKNIPILDTVLRAYKQTVTPAHKIGYLWHRFTDIKRARLARGNVYPEGFLIDEEKENLLRKLWRPLGPWGVEGEDYRIRRLYFLKDDEGDSIEEPIVPYGLLVDQKHRGVIPLPHEGGDVRLVFSAVDSESLDDGAVISIDWYGLKAGERWQKDLKMTTDGLVFEESIDGGVLEIISSNMVVVRAFLLAGQERDITPDSLYVRTYVVQEDMPLDYGIVQNQTSSVSLKVDVRIPLFEDVSSDKALVWYEFLDGNGGVVEQGDLTVDLVRSVYDRVVDALVGTSVTDPINFFVAVPPSVRTVRFQSETVALLAVYNRPERLVKVTQVPNDYYSFRPDDDDRQPTWFAKPPADDQRLLSEGRSVLLQVQQRPREDNEALLAGWYEWEDCYPQGAWAGRYILTPRNGAIPTRIEATAALYRPVPVNKDMVLQFSAIEGTNTVMPTVIFVRNQDLREEVTVLVDGKKVHSEQLIGRCGEFRLPAVFVGERKVTIHSTEDCSFFINYGLTGEQLFVRRLAQRFDEPGLTFDYQKEHEEETPVIHLYQRDLGSDETTILTVTIAGINHRKSGLHKSWTVLKRRFVVERNEESKVSVLHSRGAHVDGGQMMFVSLGGDFSQGMYTVRVDLKSGPGGYLVFSKTTPGMSETRTIHWER